jgi:MarR family transcriptional regulator, 2-MHQ and catechol-resistance regulon repressor
LTTEIPPAVLTFGRLIGAYSTLTRELNAQLIEAHGVTLNEYEVLLLLARAPDRRMRRIDLAAEVRLSPSGITRMLDRLEKTELVEKAKCETDARITYAVLTDAGMAKLRECSLDHFAAVERRLGEHLADEELASLAELLGRFTDVTEEECEPQVAPSPGS